ncbi:MAG: alpha/beta hydrolase [Solirubrobacterales bacterium]|jgi:haloalkane dehalogenase|nr:alpha/beta hydrolase [Solirubrobacterales bacterium]
MATVNAPASRRLTVAGVDTHVYDQGTGDVPVICLHGNPDSADQWAELLSRTDVLGRVIAPDLPGWGRSARPDPAVFDGSLDAHDRWFDALLDELEVDRFQLVVHDWGGLALSAASRRPAQVTRLVAIDAVPLSGAYRWHWISRCIWRPPVVGELTMKLFNRFTVKTLTRLQRPGFRPLDAAWLDRVGRDLDAGMKDAILRLYRSADPDVLARHGEHLGALTCPALLIWGDADPYVGVEEMDVLKDALGGAVQTRTVQGGHWCMLDTPEVFERTVAFLTQDR